MSVANVGLTKAGYLCDIGVKNVYLAGPMTGYPEFNFPAFNSAADDLGRWFNVNNPADLGTGGGDTSSGSISPEEWCDFLATDLAWILHEADAVVVLDGWHKSRGARSEVYVARAKGIPVLSYPILESVDESESICMEADRLVSNDRGADYGHPLDDFSKVVGMAKALWGRGPETAEEHAIYMTLVKIAREANKPKRDNRVDACGYMKTLDMVIEERERRAA